MKILITGAAGFIGSNLVDYLLNEGHTVMGIDNFANGRRTNLEKAETYNTFTFTAVDILDVDWLGKLFEDFKPEAVYHLAARGSVPASIGDPTATFNNNVLGTHNLMLIALQHKVERFVFASSSSVYGESYVNQFNGSDIRPMPKSEDLPVNPLNPYGISKYTTELYGMNFNKLYDFQCAAVRFFNVYGPRQRADIENAAVVPTFITKALKGYPISINGEGHTRDFTFVGDVCRSLSMFLRIAPHDWAGEVFNVCNGKETSVAVLASEVLSLVGGDRVPISFGTTRTGDIKQSVGCNKKLMSTLYWAPSTNIRSGLIETIEYYKGISE